MNKLTFSTALVMALSTTAVFAHHPAADNVDADTYDMITENLVDADSPHLTMDLDTMGSSMDLAVGEQSGSQMEMSGVEMDVDVAMDAASTVDTMDLMDAVADSLAQ